MENQMEVVHTLTNRFEADLLMDAWNGKVSRPCCGL